jgi:hypothetical protein
VQRGEFITRLVVELPELRDRDADFFASRELRTMPSLMLHAYVRAGLAATRGRRAWPADAYDVVHLTHGLSRCDLITADRGMVEMVRARKLLPTDIRLFESSDVGGLIAAVHTVARSGTRSTGCLTVARFSARSGRRGWVEADPRPAT